MLTKSFKNLTKFEVALWIISLLLVSVPCIFFKGQSGASVLASVIGVTALIFVSKGDVLGQILTVIFSLFYAAISYTFNYYGEMITYLFMTAPIAVLSVVSWIRNPYTKERPEVKVNKLSGKEIVFMLVLSIIVTVIFHYVLVFFNTANIVFSTVSITTSFLASYLMFRRSALYAVAYAANDVVLIILWILASMENSSYLPMVLCFAIFFVNDLYGFINWSKIKKLQNEG